MIDKFFKNSDLLSQLKGNLFDSSIDYFAEYLNRHGCSSTTAKSHIKTAVHFCYWLKNKHMPLAAVNEATVERFLSKHLKKCSCHLARESTFHSSRSALKHFLGVLRAHSLISSAQKISIPVSRIDKLIDEFCKHLEKVRGATLSTVNYYSWYIREFLKTKYVDGQVDLRRLVWDDVNEYVFAKAMVYKPKTTKNLTICLRAFFRFLKMTSQIRGALEDAVPTVPYRKLSTIPKCLTKEQLQTLLSSFNLCNPVGLRNRAMVLLMTKLGLRSCEVSQLTLDNLNWREGIIQIDKNKSRRGCSLPLPKEVGRALVAYIKKARPCSKERRIFLTHIFPVGRPIPPNTVARIIRRVFKRSGLHIRPCGSHVLRHTLATQLLQKDATLKEIADILRHRSIETTNIYAKVDLKKLVQVALPWPEVKI